MDETMFGFTSNPEALGFSDEPAGPRPALGGLGPSTRRTAEARLAMERADGGGMMGVPGLQAMMAKVKGGGCGCSGSGVTGWVGKHPWLALGVAAGGGFLVARAMR